MSERSSGTDKAGAFFDSLIERGDPLLGQIDRSAKSLLQSALTRLDVVSREEFDAQSAVLKRTRDRLEVLEKQLAELSEASHSATSDIPD